MFWSTKYSIFAKQIPAIISSIPIMAIYFFFFKNNLDEFMKFLNGFQYIKDISLLIIFIFVVFFFSRHISKYIFEDIIFDKKRKFPTTEFLVPTNNVLSKSIQNKIYSMIESDIGIKIISDDSSENTDTEIRKRIIEATKYISNSIGNGKYVLNKNIEYGFFRNLIWWSVIAFCFSLYGVIISTYPSNSFNIFLLFIWIYWGIVALSQLVLRNLANTYAETLFWEYISKK